MARIRLRGIYATALTERLRDRVTVVAPSEPIADRFETTFGAGPPDAVVADAADHRGIEVTGESAAVEAVRSALTSVARDALAWPDPTPRGSTAEATVTDPLGSGAVVDLGAREGFLPYDEVDRRVEAGDGLRVQVHEPAAPWVDRRPAVATELAVSAGPVGLVRDGGKPQATVSDPDREAELVRSLDLLSTDVPGGWSVRFGPRAADADLEVLDEALALAADRADAVTTPADDGQSRVATTWVWYGRESRFALDEDRRAVMATMPGHHRVKAATSDAGPAVDLVEAVCQPDGTGSFPFDAVVDQFGPKVGDELAISHGKPDGQRFRLGVGEVTAREGRTVTLRREMTPGGEYDGLGLPREAGDVAVTRLTEGRWWYPTVYRDDAESVKGTYVNVCTPVELFPDAATYLDLEVDVVRRADGSVERVDDDDLDAAVDAGHVPPPLAEKAREVATAVERALEP